MRLKTGLCLVTSLLILVFATLGFAEVDLKIISKLQLNEPPVDMTFSRDGQWLYLLFKNGDLLVYTYQGQLQGKVSVGRGFDQLEAGPREDEVYLLNRKAKNIQIVEVNPTRQIDISGSPFKGAADAPVVITEYTDFQCPYCAKLGAVLDQMLLMFPGKVKIVYKSFPLANHRFSWKAATSAMAAHRMGKFWAFYDRLFENYKDLNDEKIMEIRRSFGFDTPEFDALIVAPDVRAKVAGDREEGLRIGVRGTPTVFINGKRLKDKSLQGLQDAVVRELKAHP